MQVQYQRLGDSTTAFVDQSSPKQMKLDNYTICFDVMLGKGSFSSVYLCRSKENGKAAVKILSKNTQKSEHIIKVAKAEVKIIRKLKHPNIVGFIGSYQSKNNYYILFEYCQGKTLREILNIYKKIQPGDVLNIASGLINAICYLFQKKIMHRDIKPDNVKYFKGKSTLIDFGFACQLLNGEKTLFSQSIGTPSYMSPQMLQRKKYTYKSDIWSLGVVLYQIFYGKLPWTGRTENQLYNNIQTKPLIFPERVKIPLILKRIIQSCLKKKQSQRIDLKSLSQYKNIQFSHYHQQDSENLQAGKKGKFCNFLCWFD